ncbi:MAG TPA: right-handed parallel beta-helix repeat-containing protein, partial [Candidatus Nanoarchaeia archaeon]|nr:right-handed parallel beta-helix repeat-containing protein [Candidatus Nanoarchaeia archaeon]
MKKSRKLIKNYVTQSLSTGKPRDEIREELIRFGLARSEAESMISSCSRKTDPTGYILLFLLLAVIGLTISLEPILTGFATVSKTQTFSQPLNQEFSYDSTYYWTPSELGSLEAIRLTGEVSRSGSAQVYLYQGNDSYLIFDSSAIAAEELPSVENLELTEANNSGIITLNLIYGNTENYDSDNDGIETESGIIDIELSEIESGNLSPSNLCTRWKVFSEDVSEATTVCYGSEQCCGFINLAPAKDGYLSPFFLTYGRYGATEHNKVSAQIIYVNYSLDPNNPYSEVYYSAWQEIPATYVTDSFAFRRACTETCSLPGFNDSFYRLEIKVSNATLTLANITYTVKRVVLNRVPVFLDIPDLSLRGNSSATIDLSQFASDPDNDTLQFEYYISGEGISVGINGGIAKIHSADNFTGTAYVLFSANDSETTVLSNYVKVEAVEEPKYAEIVEERSVQGLAVIGKQVKWSKRISLNGTASSLRLNLSEDAINISVYSVADGLREEISNDSLRIIDHGIEKSLVAYESEKRLELIGERLDILEMKKRGIAIDKNQVREINREIVELGNELNSLTGMSVVAESSWFEELIRWISNAITTFTFSETTTSTELVIENEVEEIEVEYETPGPESLETLLGNGKKRIVVTSNTHYENILAFTSTNELPRDKIALYWVKDTGRELVTEVNYIDSNNNSLIDEIQWIVPSLSNQTYELELVILNVQSYPEFEGNWTVAFNTSGTANLTITAVEGTTYGNFSPDDLQFLELRCGADIIGADYNGTSIFVNSWNCDGQTAYHTVKTLTTGKHVQQFKFGDQTANAYNLVDSCEYPADNMLINESTVLCSGAYNLTDAGSDGLIKIQSDSVRLYCNGTIIIGNAVNYGIGLTGAFDNITVEGCTLMNLTPGISIANPVNNFTILNNTLINASLSVGASTNGLIQENFIANYSIGGGARCIDVSAGSENVTVADNIITGCTQWGIYIPGTVSNWTIARNNFSRNGYGSI